jgi:hypothetical protein
MPVRPAKAAPTPFVPLRTITAGENSAQRLYPAIDANGVPFWQPGDIEIQAWEIHSIGWSHGGTGGRRDHTDLKGHVYVTGARIVVASTRFVSGSKYRGYSAGEMLSGPGQPQVSQQRAQRQAAGQALAAQMRLPWITSIVFAPVRSGRTLGGEIRICGQHLTVFGDPELVMLTFRLAQPSETNRLVDVVTAQVRADRREWSRTTDELRVALDGIPAADTVTAAPDRLPTITLPGGYRVGPSTVINGVNSALSFPATPTAVT